MSDAHGSGQRPAGAPVATGPGRGPGMTGPGRGPGGHRGGHMGGGHMGGLGMPVEKPRNFKGSLKRLVAYLKPRSGALVAVLALAIVSTVFAIFAPKIMGNVTTRIFEGVKAKMMHLPGAAIDFAYVGQVVVLLIGLYVVSGIFSYLQQYIMAGVAQKTVYDMRRDVNDKLTRLPLSFFDQRGRH